MTIGMLVDNAAYASFALVSLILLIPRARFVRVLVALFAGIWLAHALLTTRDQTTIIWMSVMLGAALLLLMADLLGRRRTRLSTEEQDFAGRLLPGVSRSSVRHFLEQGFWLNGKAGDLLMQEGEEVRHLYYLSEGEAKVVMTGKQVGSCRAGALLGESALFNGETAVADVILAGQSRFWCAPAERLKPYLEVHTQLRRALERGIATAAKQQP
jgi:hypothetical protein